MTTPRHVIWMACIAWSASACGAQRVLYKPTAVERAQLAEPPIPLSVVVVQWRAGNSVAQSAKAYGDDIAKLIIGSHAFSNATYDPPPTRAVVGDLTAESTGDYCNTAIIPLFSIITLGVFPTIWTETQCDGAVFRRYGAPPGSDSVVVRIRYSTKAMMGWLALPVGLLPGWSWKSGDDQASYKKAFRLAVIAKRDELTRLAGH
jgi:hypothetical protein